MTKRALPAFLSIGQQFRPEHTFFVHAIGSALRLRGVNLRPLPHDHRNADAPVQPVVLFMRQCFGTIVIAFPRIHFEAAWEWPGSPKQMALERHDVASVWLQIEAALAFELGHPILILVDDRLHPEGMLNPKHPAYHASYFNMAECCKGLPQPLLTAIDDFALRVQHYAATTTRLAGDVPNGGKCSAEGA